jgi:DNA gyrase/topoisomerase IV subunit A
MLEGKSFMLSPENLNKTINIFRSCEARDEIVPSIVKAYNGKVTSSQANYVSELRVYNLTNGEYKKTIKAMESVQKDIDYIRNIIETPNKVCEVIIDEIKTIKHLYGTPRKSKILNLDSNENVNIGVVQILPDGNILFSETENPEHLSSDITPISSDEVCLIDDQGFFLWVDTAHVDHDKPMTMTSIGKSQMGKCVFAERLC